jgi:hypothetical protein
MKNEITFVGDKNVFKHSKSFIESRDQLLKDFLNAETPYDRYKTMMKAISWLECKEEIAYYREQEIVNLRSQNNVKS